MSADPNHTPEHVYAVAYHAYWQAGWRGILPLPPRSKKLPPSGYTGNNGTNPSYPDCVDWADMYPDANIALRLPENIIGLDVDNYDNKPGGATLTALQTAFGALPPTWRTTSRDDGTSGIRLYQAPPGLAWPSVAGTGIEIIRHSHRYAVAHPSLHPTGNRYRWLTPDGATAIGGQVPHPDQLPHLPQAWVDGLTHGRQQSTRAPGAGLDTAATTAWVTANDRGTTPCPSMVAAIDKWATVLRSGSSRHDAAMHGLWRIIHAASDGHTGLTTALDTLRAVWDTTAGADPTRTDDPATEWARLLHGAIDDAATTQETPPTGDPCNDPLTLYTLKAPPTPDQILHPPTTPPGPEAGPVAQEDTGTTTTNLPPSWRPIDLTPYLDGTWTPPTPTMLTRTDGHHLIYPGLVHDIHGESESGKSLVAQHLTVEQLAAGGPVLYVDFESDAGQISHRLLAMGATTHQLLTHLTYIRPEASPYALTETTEWATLLTRTFTLATFDGVTDALGQFGATTKDNDDIAAWHRMVPRTLSIRTGAAVVLIDHVTKNTDTRGRFAIGGQAKMASIDGASYNVEIVEPLGKGLKGMVTIRVGKDRPGEIRPICGPYRASDRSQEAARIEFDSTTRTRINVTVHGPEGSVTDRDDGKAFKPTGIMEKLSKLLQVVGEPMSKRNILRSHKADGGKARDQTIYDALNRLIEGGWVVESDAYRGHPTFAHERAYRQCEDPESDAFDAPIDQITPPLRTVLPTASRVLPGSTNDSASPLPPPEGGSGSTQTDDGSETASASQPKSEYKYDYRIGEYVHPTTGELWDGD